MTRSAQDAVAIASQVAAEIARAPRARRLADDVQDFLESGGARLLTANERDHWGAVAVAFGEAGKVTCGSVQRDITEQEDVSYRSQLAALKARAA